MMISDIFKIKKSEEEKPSERKEVSPKPPAEIPGRLEYYMEFHPISNSKDVRKKKFHVANISRFMDLLETNMYVVIYLRREIDGHVFVENGRVHLYRQRVLSQLTR